MLHVNSINLLKIKVYIPLFRGKIDDSFYNEDEHTFSLCEKHHIELCDATIKYDETGEEPNIKWDGSNWVMSEERGRELIDAVYNAFESYWNNVRGVW